VPFNSVFVSAARHKNSHSLGRVGNLKGKEEAMVYRYLAVLLLLGIVSVGSLSSTRPSWAETLVQQNVDTRVVLAFRVGEAELQGWLPAPWQVNPTATGPSKDANLTVTFIDRLLNQDSEGKPIAGGTDRLVALSVPAKQGQTG
jgi:hypothetical protein